MRAHAHTHTHFSALLHIFFWILSSRCKRTQVPKEATLTVNRLKSWSWGGNLERWWERDLRDFIAKRTNTFPTVQRLKKIRNFFSDIYFLLHMTRKYSRYVVEKIYLKLSKIYWRWTLLNYFYILSLRHRSILPVCIC